MQASWNACPSSFSRSCSSRFDGRVATRNLTGAEAGRVIEAAKAARDGAIIRKLALCPCL